MTDTLGPYLLGPNDTPENGIYTGDARELAKTIPDESVDLIFTDPIYQNIDDYRWLAETAARVLKGGRACLAWNSIERINETMQAMSDYLQYRWQFVSIRPSGYKSRYAMKNVFSNWKSLLWFAENKTFPIRPMSDVSYSSDNRWRGMKLWGKTMVSTAQWLVKFTDAPDIVLDPFTGGGTVPAVCKMFGRRYLAFEIDPDVAETARERVRNAQMPLFVLEPEQERMQLE